MKARVGLSKSTKRIMDDEIKKQILIADRKFCVESDANVLWTLHNDFGFGKDRLLKFWRIVSSNHDELRERYDFHSDEEMGWLYVKLLKDSTGIDVSELYKEFGK